MSMSTGVQGREPEHRSTGYPLHEILDGVTSISELEHRCATHFFVRHVSRRPPALEPLQTHSGRGPMLDVTGELIILVFPLRRGPRSNQAFISIGRTEGNDVCLPNETVSKFHAFLHPTPGGLVLQDARSRNGTTVDGVAIPGRGSGEALLLKTGQTVRFGTVATAFCDGETLLMLGRRVRC